jgi:hypothetical protein
VHIKKNYSSFIKLDYLINNIVYGSKMWNFPDNSYEKYYVKGEYHKFCCNNNLTYSVFDCPLLQDKNLIIGDKFIILYDELLKNHKQIDFIELEQFHIDNYYIGDMSNVDYSTELDFNNLKISTKIFDIGVNQGI